MPRPRPAKIKPDARSLAQACLESVLLQGAPVQYALDAAIRESKTSARDVGLATELVYGYLRLKARHDHTVALHLSKPGKLPPGLRILLGHCAHALAELDRVPAYATVDWGVQTAKKRFGPGLGKLTNAVLRKIATIGADARTQEFHRVKGDNETRFLARYYSCPEWIVDLWRTSYGAETALHYLLAQASAPPVGIRLNKTHSGYASMTAHMAAAEKVLVSSPPGYALSDSAALPDLAAQEKDGALSRQSLASLQALQALGLQEWEAPLWDACCGHGGKTCAILEEHGNDFDVWASDPDKGRLRGLARQLKRLGLPHIPLFLADASRPPVGGEPGSALSLTRPKTILIDAPCSGLGVLSRRPDAKWRRTPQDVAKLDALQSQILNAAVSLLPTGGRLVYVTCTLHPKENEQQIAALTEQHPSLRLEHEWCTQSDSPLYEFFFGATFTL